MSETDQQTESAPTPPEASMAVQPPTDWEAKFKAQQKVNRDLERKLNEARNRPDATEAPPAVDLDAIRREAVEAAAGEWNRKLLLAEIRAEAVGKLADPADAVKFLDLDSIGGGEGASTEAIREAIDQLVGAKPYLAARSGDKWQGTADQGVRNGPETNIDSLIAAAEKARDFPRVITLKRQKAATNRS